MCLKGTSAAVREVPTPICGMLLSDGVLSSVRCSFQYRVRHWQSDIVVSEDEISRRLNDNILTARSGTATTKSREDNRTLLKWRGGL